MFLSLSPEILTFILPFAVLFSTSNWKNAQIMLFGAILCRGRRTVCSILRTLGLQNEPGFSKYHRLLNHAKWSAMQGSCILLRMLLQCIPKGVRPVIFIDETLERRKGKRIKEKGLYRDAVASTKSNVVKRYGLKWLVMSLSIRFSFAKRSFALPFFTVLEPSSRFCKQQKKRHKTTMDWSRQMIKQLVRSIPNLSFILVGDGGFATGELAWTCLSYKIALVSRLKMNASLYDFPPEVEPGKKGRRAKKGRRLMNFKQMLGVTDLNWQDAEIMGYGGQKKAVRYLTNTCLWGVDGFHPVPIRWVLMIDPSGGLDPLPLMSTDVSLSATEIIALYIDRWSIEVTFEEVREHLGVETQRQWSEKAIHRTTPILMGLYSLVCLMANELSKVQEIEMESTAWYQKEAATFADLLKAVRKELWRDNLFLGKTIFGASGENNELDQQIWRELLIDCLSKAA
jgi:hypothetical protein